MNYQDIKNDDPIQLKQMIIFLKAELIKYETIDSISEMNQLREENNQLINENEMLAKQIEELHKEGNHSIVSRIKELPIDWGPVHERFETLSKMLQESTSQQTTIQQLTEKIGEQTGEIAELKKGIEEKEGVIEALQNEVTWFKKENDKLSTTLHTISPEVVQQMDVQMKEVLKKAVEYEAHIDGKLEMIAQIEREFDTECQSLPQFRHYPDNGSK